MIRLADRSSHLGHGYPARGDAIAATEHYMHEIETAIPAFKTHADRWRAGDCAGDTVTGGGHVFGLYPYDGTRADLADQGALWVVDFAGRAGISLR